MLLVRSSIYNINANSILFFYCMSSGGSAFGMPLGMSEVHCTIIILPMWLETIDFPLARREGNILSRMFP